jgi:hypothetical protein
MPLNPNCPEETLQLNAESEFQMVDSHQVEPTTTATEKSLTPKTFPNTVTTVPPD